MTTTEVRIKQTGDCNHWSYLHNSRMPSMGTPYYTNFTFNFWSQHKISNIQNTQVNTWLGKYNQLFLI